MLSFEHALLELKQRGYMVMDIQYGEAATKARLVCSDKKEWRLDWDEQTQTGMLWERMTSGEAHGQIWRNHASIRTWGDLIWTMR